MIAPVKIPELAPIGAGNVLAVPKDEFNTLVDGVNKVIEVVNAQTVQIEQITSELTTCKQNISNLAKILEEVYDA